MQALIEQIRYHTRKHEPEGGDMKKIDRSILARRFQQDSLSIETEETINLVRPNNHNENEAMTPKMIATTTTTTTTNDDIDDRQRQERQQHLICLDYSNRKKRFATSPSSSTSTIFNHPSIISIMIVFYIIISSNLSLNTILNISSSTTTTTRFPYRSNELTALIGERSLLQMVDASPAPAPANARAATAAQRMPPINGSIFGKRSLDNMAKRKRKDKAKTATTERGQQMADERRSATASNEITTTTIAPSTSSEPANYNDIITDLIEEFLYQNNESEPEESTVAFCRMVVYECNQVLRARHLKVMNSANKRSSSRRR